MALLRHAPLLLALLPALGLPGPPRVRVHAAHLGAAERARVARIASAALRTAENALGRRVGTTVGVTLVRRTRDLPASVRRSFRPWTVAIARGDGADVWIVTTRVRPDPPDDLRSVLVHEMVHIVLGDLETALSAGRRHVPRWLHEGLAQHVAESIFLAGSEEIVWFRAATNRLLRWHDLTEFFPDDREDATVAYAQSASFVAFLDRELGLATIMRTVRAYLAGDAENLDAALSGIEWGRSYTRLTGAWVEDLKGRGLLFFVRANCFNFLIVLAVPLLGLVLYKRFRRERNASERLEEFEVEQEMARRARDEESRR